MKRLWLNVSIGIVAAWTAAAAGRDGKLELPMLWTVNLNTLLESAPTLHDLNGDGRQEILIAGREEMFALDGDGQEFWRWRTKGRFMTYPSVLDRKGDAPLIYAADTAGLLSCLDAAGKVVWQAQLDGPSSWSASVVSDLNGDGAADLVQTDERGTVWVFDALTGKVLWKTTINGIPVSPAVGDLNEDGKPEIVVATGQGLLAALDCAGKPLWECPTGSASQSWSTGAPIIFGAADGRARVVVASNDGDLICLDGAGAVLWRRLLRGPAASSISVGDVENTGRADLFVVTQLGTIYRFDENGGLRWKIDMEGRSLAAGAIVDLDGDGRLEYALCTQGGRLLVLNDRGEFVFDLQFDTRTINVTPCIADVSRKSPGLEMVITGGESGRVFCLATPAPADALLQWAAYRLDARKTGAWFGLAQAEAGRAAKTVRMTPSNLAPDTVFTGEPIRFVIQNPKPDPKPLTATATCIRPDGARETATTKVLAEHGEVLLPVEIVSPGTYAFRWSLTNARGDELASGSRDVFLEPFANDRALVTRALDAIASISAAAEKPLPASAAALRREATLLKTAADAVTPLQDAARGNDPAVVQKTLEQTASLAAGARRARRVADVIKQAIALGPGTGVVPFEARLWESRDVGSQLPSRVRNPLTISRRVVPGEHEPVALGLFNLGDADCSVRVSVEAPPDGPTVILHHSVSVPTSLGERSWDPLPELDAERVLTIPSLSTQELWLDLAIGAGKPGPQALKIHLQAVEGASNPQPQKEAVVDVNLDVLPFRMAPPGAFRLCAWATLGKAECEDLLAHGNNVFVGPHGEPQYDAQGRLSGFDYAKLDAFAAPFAGNDVVLLLNGVPAVHGEWGSAAYQADLKAYLDDLVAHIAKIGYDKQHFALYPYDEPGGNGMDFANKFVEFGKMVRAANPDVLIYVDGGGEEPVFKAWAPYVDVWCPGLHMLPEDSPEMKIIRATGKTLWSYNCAYPYSRPIGTNLKNINVVAEYRDAALFGYRYGATGIGFWCYNIGGNQWTQTDLDYPMVYPAPIKPVTSRRWEAVREGIEDVRILIALQQRLNPNAQPPLSDDLRRRIRRLIEVSLPGIIDQSYNEMKLGLARNVLDATNNDNTIAAFRQEILDCAQALTAH